MSRKNNPVPLVVISLDDEDEDDGDMEQVDSGTFQQYVYAASEAPLGMYSPQPPSYVMSESYNPPSYTPLSFPFDTPPPRKHSAPPLPSQQYKMTSQTPPRAPKPIPSKPAMNKAISVPNMRKPSPKQPPKTNTSANTQKTPTKAKANSTTNLRGNTTTSRVNGTSNLRNNDSPMYNNPNYTNNIDYEDDVYNNQPDLYFQQPANPKPKTRSISPGKKQTYPPPR